MTLVSWWPFSRATPGRPKPPVTSNAFRHDLLMQSRDAFPDEERATQASRHPQSSRTRFSYDSLRPVGIRELAEHPPQPLPPLVVDHLEVRIGVVDAALHLHAHRVALVDEQVDRQ